METLDAGDALNAAIRMQEASLHHGDLGGTRCAIGIALGLVTFYAFAIGLGVNLPAGILQGIL